MRSYKFARRIVGDDAVILNPDIRGNRQAHGLRKQKTRNQSFPLDLECVQSPVAGRSRTKKLSSAKTGMETVVGEVQKVIEL